LTAVVLASANYVLSRRLGCLDHDAVISNAWKRSHFGDLDGCLRLPCEANNPRHVSSASRSQAVRHPGVQLRRDPRSVQRFARSPGSRQHRLLLAGRVPGAPISPADILRMFAHAIPIRFHDCIAGFRAARRSLTSPIRHRGHNGDDQLPAPSRIERLGHRMSATFRFSKSSRNHTVLDAPGQPISLAMITASPFFVHPERAAAPCLPTRFLATRRHRRSNRELSSCTTHGTDFTSCTSSETPSLGCCL